MAGHSCAKDWGTSVATSLYELIRDKDSFNDEMTLWCASSTTDMDSMLWPTSFRARARMWGVGKVTSILSMFQPATYFNKDIPLWGTSFVATALFVLRCTSFSTCFPQSE